MRIAIGGILHETSTFVSTQTSLSDFEFDRGIVRGDDMIERFRYGPEMMNVQGDRTQHGALAIRYSLTVVTLTGVLGSALFYLASRGLREDHRLSTGLRAPSRSRMTSRTRDSEIFFVSWTNASSSVLSQTMFTTRGMPPAYS